MIGWNTLDNDDSVAGWATRAKFRKNPNPSIKGYYSSEVERCEAAVKTINERKALQSSSKKDRWLFKEKRLCRSLEDFS